MPSIRSSRAGFTLVELLIGIALIAVVLMGAGEVYLVTQRSFREGSHKLVAQREATQLAQTISRRARDGAYFHAYQLPHREIETDSGDGFAIFDKDGGVLGRFEFSDAESTVVDSTGARQSPLHLERAIFSVDPAAPRVLRFGFRVLDAWGGHVDIESGASARN